MGTSLSLKERYIKQVEQKAEKYYQASKLGEDTYVIPTNIVNTKLIQDNYRMSMFYHDDNFINELKRLVVNENDFISVTFKEELPDKRMVLRINNLKDMDNNAVEAIAPGMLDNDEREALINVIADTFRGVRNVNVAFYIRCNFNMLEDLLQQE